MIKKFFNKSKLNNTISILVRLTKTSVGIYLFENSSSFSKNTIDQESILDFVVIPKNKLQESLVELFFEMLSKNNLSLKEMEHLFYIDEHSSWNANRLITLFVKTLGIYAPLNIYYLKNTKVSETDISNESLSGLSISIEDFEKINNALKLEPYYDTCQITNI